MNSINQYNKQSVIDEFIPEKLEKVHIDNNFSRIRALGCSSSDKVYKLIEINSFSEFVMKDIYSGCYSTFPASTNDGNWLKVTDLNKLSKYEACIINQTILNKSIEQFKTIFDETESVFAVWF